MRSHTIVLLGLGLLLAGCGAHYGPRPAMAHYQGAYYGQLGPPPAYHPPPYYGRRVVMNDRPYAPRHYGSPPPYGYGGRKVIRSGPRCDQGTYSAKWGKCISEFHDIELTAEQKATLASCERIETRYVTRGNKIVQQQRCAR